MSKLKNPRHEKFANLYYAGPDHIRGNATAAYAEAYDREKDHTAAVEGSRLLKRPDVRARMEEIKDEAAEEARARARTWWELYPKAQQTLLRAAEGDWPDDMEDQDKRSAVEAAKEIVNRCEGTPQQVHEHKLSGQAGLVVVAGPDHRQAEGGQGGRSDPRLRSGPRIIEAGEEPDGA